MANYEESANNVWENIPHANEEEFKDSKGDRLVGIICYKDEYLEVLSNKRRYQEENNRLKRKYETKLAMERQFSKNAFYSGMFVGLFSAIYYFKRMKPGLDLLKERRKAEQDALDKEVEEAVKQCEEFTKKTERAKKQAQEAKAAAEAETESKQESK